MVFLTREGASLDLKRKTILLGLVFVVFLAIAYFENIMFYRVVGNFF